MLLIDCSSSGRTGWADKPYVAAWVAGIGVATSLVLLGFILVMPTGDMLFLAICKAPQSNQEEDGFSWAPSVYHSALVFLHGIGKALFSCSPFVKNTSDILII